MAGSDKEIWDTVVHQGIELQVQVHTMTRGFQVMNIALEDVVLGREWLHSKGSTLKQSYEHNSLYFMVNGKHVLFWVSVMSHQHLPYVIMSFFFYKN